MLHRGVGRSLVVRRTFSGYAVVLAALALPGHSSEAVSPRHSDVTSRPSPSLRLFPRVAMRGQAVLVRVTDVDVPSLEVNVVGGTSVHGQALRWKPLRFSDGAWRGALPLPVRRGIYPVELRVRERGRVMASGRLALARVRTRHPVEAGVPRAARGRGVVGANACIPAESSSQRGAGVSRSTTFAIPVDTRGS